MKKKFFTAIAILSALVFSGCAGNVSDTEHAVMTKNEKLVEYTKIHEADKGFVGNDNYINSVKHFKYKNHEYIQFTVYEGSQFATGGVVHDPDCECRKNINENI